jgi:hypothetical protein
MTLTTVFRSFSSAEAQLIRSRLEAAGFTPHINHELAALSMEGYSMTTGGIFVDVPADQAEEAMELLSATAVTQE